MQDTIKYERNLTADEEIVTVEVKFQPLKIQTMTKDFAVKVRWSFFYHTGKSCTQLFVLVLPVLVLILPMASCLGIKYTVLLATFTVPQTSIGSVCLQSFHAEP